MCGGVYYTYHNNDTRVYFQNPKGMLPAKTRKGECILLPWGRRQNQQGKLPIGGWARLDSIYAGRWDRFFPKPAKLCIKSFMEKDIEGHSHWFDLTAGQYIQGLIARDGTERRIYIVTITPEMSEDTYERWPKIIS